MDIIKETPECRINIFFSDEVAKARELYERIIEVLRQSFKVTAGAFSSQPDSPIARFIEKGRTIDYYSVALVFVENLNAKDDPIKIISQIGVENIFVYYQNL